MTRSSEVLVDRVGYLHALNAVYTIGTCAVVFLTPNFIGAQWKCVLGSASIYNGVNHSLRRIHSYIVSIGIVVEQITLAHGAGLQFRRVTL